MGSSDGSAVRGSIIELDQLLLGSSCLAFFCCMLSNDNSLVKRLLRPLEFAEYATDSLPESLDRGDAENPSILTKDSDFGIVSDRDSS